MYTKYCFINVAALILVCLTQFQSAISAMNTDTSDPTTELSSSSSITSVSITSITPTFTVTTQSNTITNTTTGSLATFTTNTQSGTASPANNGPIITSMTGTESGTASPANNGPIITSMTETETNTAFMANTGTVTGADSVAVSGATTEMMDFTANTATSATTNAPITTNITLIYQYPFKSDDVLFIGNTTNSTVLLSVENLIKQSFNRTNFLIKVLLVNIRISQQAKTLPYYILTAIIQFTGNNCDENCIKSAMQAPNTSISLPTAAGTFVNVTFQTKPDSVSAFPTSTVIYPIGGPSPGLPGQLGMGLGISFFFVLLIGTVIFFYWKYGLSDSPRTNEYAMTRY